ncbi:glutamate--cysteine ligase [Streptomyces sp. KK5PA1]|uniref:Putative glutamate--cysteine ligase 2 n=2 Tax=Actinacidiphila acididurans TaxID=2784346 RepID=A0ABS2TXU0_9ACTN|nr:glutamate--cysteine ligase [Actinacidiphila acididurans]
MAATLGVEEEYLLLDRGTALPSPSAGLVQSAADLEPVLTRGEVTSELLQAQIEIATPVCTGLDEVTAHLARLRQALAAAALRTGCRLAATGGAPLSTGHAVPVTQKQRYREMHADAARLVDEQLICGMHIHVAVPDRSAGAAALGRIRPWLPLLVALGANSPFWDGRDTGFASWRTVVFGRWPVSGSPPFVSGGAQYERRVAALLATGVIPDRKQIYWHARLSEGYPTLEVRAPDVQVDVDSAVTLAGLTRAMVATALREARHGVRPLDPPGSILYASGWHAARHGLTDDLVDPRHGTPDAAADVVAALLDHVRPALNCFGDTDRVTAGVERLITRGTGAARQRAALATGGLDALLDLIAPAREPAGGSARGSAREPAPRPADDTRPGLAPQTGAAPQNGSGTARPVAPEFGALPEPGALRPGRAAHRPDPAHTLPGPGGAG